MNRIFSLNTRRSVSHTIIDLQSSAQWVFGIDDYAGPFEPDCDGNNGNVWALFAVETGHTDMGFVELSHNKAGPDSLRGVKGMIREMHVTGPDPTCKPVALLRMYTLIMILRSMQSWRLIY